MLAAFLNWLFFHAGSTVAGLFLSTEGLGVFALGFSVAILIPGFLASSLEDVAFPAFCEIQGNPGDVGKNLAVVQSLAAAVLCPMLLTISAIAPVLVRLLYGSKWQGLGTVISILVVMPGLGYIWSLNQAAYEAVGRPDLWTKMLGSSLAFILPALWLAAPRGLTAFTLSRFAGGWIVPLANVYLCSRILKVRMRDQLRGLIPSLPLSLGIFGVLRILIGQGPPFEGLSGWIRLSAMCFAAGLGYLGLLRFLRRDLWDLLLLNLRRALS